MNWIIEAENLTELMEGRFTLSTKPLVRCKDCKNWEVKEDNGFYFYETCVLSGFNTTCDDYCSYGERRTDGEIH